MACGLAILSIFVAADKVIWFQSVEWDAMYVICMGKNKDTYSWSLLTQWYHDIEMFSGPLGQRNPLANVTLKDIIWALFLAWPNCWTNSYSLQNKIRNLPDQSRILPKFIYDKEGKLAGLTQILLVRVRGLALILKTAVKLLVISADACDIFVMSLDTAERKWNNYIVIVTWTVIVCVLSGQYWNTINMKLVTWGLFY